MRFGRGEARDSGMDAPEPMELDVGARRIGGCRGDDSRLGRDLEGGQPLRGCDATRWRPWRTPNSSGRKSQLGLSTICICIAMDLHLARVEKRLPFPRKVLELAFLVAEEAYFFLIELI